MSQEDKNLLIESYAKSREKALIKSYINDGPTELRENLGLTEKQWSVLFEYLVFNHDLLRKCVKGNGEFFVDSYIKHGMDYVRDLLSISDKKYDQYALELFDYLAIENDGLYYHALQNREKYLVAFRARGGDFLRTKLLISNARYDDFWEKILNLFLHDYCDSLVSERMFEDSLSAFTQMMNALREHRPVEKSEILRKNQV